MTEPDLPVEAPDADTAEQRTSLRGDDVLARRSSLPPEADEADAVEQTIAVPDDEDDYRAS